MPNTLDRATLEAALIGYQHQVEEIQGKIADIRRMIGGSGPAPAAATSAAQPKAKKAAPQRKQKHKMSAEGRARIAAAQRARWAKVKKGQ
jgi:hypothetical protein